MDEEQTIESSVHIHNRNDPVNKETKLVGSEQYGLEEKGKEEVQAVRKDGKPKSQRPMKKSA